MFNIDINDLFGSTKKLVGLDIGSSALKVAEILETPSGYLLNQFSQISLPKGVIVDGLLVEHDVLTQTIKELFKQSKLNPKHIVTSLSGQSVIVKRVNIPTMEENEVRDMIHDEASKYLPFDNMDDVNFDFQILGVNEYNPNQMDILIVAVKKDYIEPFVEAVENAGVSVDIMDVDSFAIENMFEENYEPDENDLVVLINIGASITNINVVKNGASIFLRDFNLGGNAVTEAIQEKFGVSFEEAERMKVEGTADDKMSEKEFRDSLLSYAEVICLEIERSVDYFRSTSGGEDIKQVLLSGGGAKIPGIAVDLTQRLNIDTEIIDPFKKIDYNKKNLDETIIEQIGPAVGVGVGLALRRIGDK
ncbi:MAG: type IV pilus assembly protein PilM [Deltaproteobacteria bacterium]|nr:type IV pilus assembly protein PilM [Deltaproteobacteria bacterium]